MHRYSIYLIAFVALLTLPLIAVISITLGQDEITENEDFFTLSITGTPDIDIDSWTLSIEGMVEHHLELTYDNITSFQRTEVTATLKCVEGPTDRAEWTGVNVSTILDMAMVEPGAKEIIFYSVDGYSSSLTLDDATSEGVLLAYMMNGETLPADHGYPLRLVAPGKAGYKWVKWIERIEIIDYDYEGYWESRGWDDDADLSTLNEWELHAALLSIGFIFGGVALISGYSLKAIEDWERPSYLNSRFHIGVSIIYLSILVMVFIFWAYTTYTMRGDVFYTGHGAMALMVIALHLVGGITGIPRLHRQTWAKVFHRSLNLFAFTLYFGVILLGLILASGGVI